MGFKLLRNTKFLKIVNKIRGFYQKALGKLEYNLYDEIKGHEFNKSADPEKEAVKWFKSYSRRPENQVGTRLMEQGKMYSFNYQEPLGFDDQTLPYADFNPLIICIGSFVSTSGNVLSLGINLHWLPPEVRKLVVYEIINKLYKMKYLEQYGSKIQQSVNVEWKQLKQPLEKFGINFAIKAYYVNRVRNNVNIRTEDIASAIFVPSQLGFYKKDRSVFTKSDMNKEWVKFLSRKKITHVAGERF